MGACSNNNMFLIQSPLKIVNPVLDAARYTNTIGNFNVVGVV